MFTKPTLFLLPFFATLSLAQQICHNGYCCSGLIIGDCNSQNPSDLICCQGDPNFGLDSCVTNNGNAQPTCTAGQATPLTAAGSSAITIGGITQNFGSATSSATAVVTSSPSSSSSSGGFFGSSFSEMFTGNLHGTHGNTVIVSAGITVSNGVTLTGGGTQTTAGPAGASASPSPSGNAAAGLIGLNGLAVGAVPLAWLVGGF